MQSARAIRRLGALLTASAALVVPAVASAQTTTIGGAVLEQFDPAPAGDAFFGVPSPWVGGSLVPRAYVMVDYAHAPLTLTAADGSTIGSVVSRQIYARVNVSLAVADRALLSVDVPGAIAQAGDNPIDGNLQFNSPTGGQFGDVRLGARVRALGDDASPFQLAVGAYGYAPSGGSGGWTGEGKFRGGPHLVLGGQSPKFVWSASVGSMLRGSDLPSSLLFGGGGGLLAADGMLQIGPEIFGAAPLGSGNTASPSSVLVSSDRLNLEMLFGLKLRVAKVIVLGIGAGPGLTHAPGTPRARGVFSIAFDPRPDTAAALAAAELDTDADGVVDPKDACPNEPGVSNADPNLNGCPAKDSDKDGIADADDACPNVAGVKSSDAKKNGCPSDRDGDGIVDASDACPDKKGIKDADPKRNGCPEDSDGDGIKDVVDACPEEAGEANPEPRKNGCPKAVRVTEDEIVILKQVKFRYGQSSISETVDPVSDDLLTEVRDAVTQHTEILKIEIQGHTDNVGGVEYNTKLSQNRAIAVRSWLVDHGIPASKLDVRGFGPSKPVADNGTEDGRQANRRVQFKIRKRKK